MNSANLLFKHRENKKNKWLKTLYVVVFCFMLMAIVIVTAGIRSEINEQSKQIAIKNVNSLTDTMLEFLSFNENILLSTAQRLSRNNHENLHQPASISGISQLSKQIKSVAILDLDYQVVVASGEYYADDWRGLFSVQGLQKSSIGKPFRMSAFGDYFLPMLVPIYNTEDKTGDICCYLAATFQVIGEDGIWSTSSVNIKNTTIQLVADDGEVYAAYPENISLLPSFFTQRVSAAILDELSTIKDKKHVAGDVAQRTERIYFNAQKVPDFGGYVVASFKYNDLLETWITKTKPTVLLILAVYFFTILILKLGIRRAKKIEKEKILAESNVSKLSKAIEQSPSSVIVTDNQWITEYANKKLLDGQGQIIEIPAEVVLVDNYPHDLLTPDLEKILVTLRLGENWYCERSDASSQQWYSFSISKMVGESEIRNSNNESYIIITQNITERKKAETRLYNQAYFDSLTGLPNRRNSTILLQKEIVEARKNGGQVALIYLDLDNFKSVNDRYGHAIGDQLLQTIAHRIQSSIHNIGTACHMSGDEFLAFLPYTDKNHVITLIESIIAQITSPIALEGKELFVTMSMGVSCFPHDCKDENMMLKHADIALYFSKESGRNCYSFFDANLEAINRRKMELESEIRTALERNELYMVYQTKNSISDYTVCSFEALMRWQSPKLGAVGPDEFITAAESIGAIEKMGEFALYQACHDLKRFQKEVTQPLTMAVNLSMRQLKNDDIVDIVKGVLEKEQINPAQLELEITETLLAESFDIVLPVLNKLLALGVSLSIDDFGTGYSSLNYLTRFPVNTLKVDRCFIMDMVNNTKDSALTESVILMAHRLGLKVVAEGIEDLSQIALLQEFNCDIGQGYYYTRPINVEDMIGLLKNQSAIIDKINRDMQNPDLKATAKQSALILPSEDVVLNTPLVELKEASSDTDLTAFDEDSLYHEFTDLKDVSINDELVSLEKSLNDQEFIDSDEYLLDDELLNDNVSIQELSELVEHSVDNKKTDVKKNNRSVGLELE
jgi:diguanylate cyclase (GGDEF)-like protein